jgi:hypothetical protein
MSGVNIGTIAPTAKTPAPVAEKMQEEPQDENSAAIVPSIKQQDTISRTTGSDGDIDVGEEREPTEKTATEDLEQLSKLDSESLKMLITGIINSCELGKYSEIDFTPPQGAREAAKRALVVRAEKPSSQRGMTSIGIARARDLIAGKKLSPDTIRRMHSFFSRHEVDKKGKGWDDQGKGWQAWNGWGGDAGFSWVKKLVKQMDSRDEKLEEPATCPIATQDVKTNLANRQNAVDDANYGPANPNEPNEDYWKAKADEFQGDVVTAKKMLCGNCAAFNQTSKLLGCIKKGIGEDANEVAVGGNLGYCEIFDFKCASKRTCDAWIVGGPITDDKKKVTNFVAGRDCGQDEGGTFGPDNECAVGYGRPPFKGGYTPTRPGGKVPSNYKRPTPQDRSKKPKTPEPTKAKPIATKPPPPPPPPPTKKPTEEKPAVKSKFPNATKEYDSKERASLDPVIKENQKQLESLRENIIKQTEEAEKERESAKNKYLAIKENIKETQRKISKLAETTDKERYFPGSVDAKSVAEANSQIEKEISKRDSLKKELEEPERILEAAKEKIRQIGLNAIRKDMLDINKQDGFSAEELSKATEELKQKQHTAIAADKRSIKESKDAGAVRQREKGQDVLRSIFNPNIHSESLSKPITYSGKSRAYSDGQTIEFADGKRIASLNGIVINKQTNLKTILHEYGHQVESGNPEAHDLCSDFLKKRTSGEKAQKYQKVFSGYGYGKNEKGSPDDFEKSFKAVFPESDTKVKAYYAGKIYEERPFGGSSKYVAPTEVYSMGMELLHENPVKFAQTDPEWFDLVSGIATGRLLKKTRGLK